MLFSKKGHIDKLKIMLDFHGVKADLQNKVSKIRCSFSFVIYIFAFCGLLINVFFF